jgi:hypothetical protein
MTTTTIRSYSELVQYDDFFERFRYLALRASVGVATFGFDRWVNQEFYSSRQWRTVRRHVILRDEGNDLGVDGYEIHDRVYIHHMNPMSVNDIVGDEGWIFDPEFLITTCHRTHNAIHYGDERQLPRPFVERSPGDHILWGKGKS